MGSTSAATVSATGIVNVNNTTEATSTTDDSLQTDGGLSVAKVLLLWWFRFLSNGNLYEYWWLSKIYYYTPKF